MGEMKAADFYFSHKNSADSPDGGSVIDAFLKSRRLNTIASVYPHSTPYCVCFSFCDSTDAFPHMDLLTR